MTLLALGINHKTAPVSLRERMIFSVDSVDQALGSLRRLPLVQGGVLLSTCNRTELYLSVEQQENMYEHVYEQLIAWLCCYHHIHPHELNKSLYWHQGSAAVSHLMRVTSGLDSQILGEPQIFGQVKRAFATSQRGRSLSGELERLFQKSFSVAKRIRSETDIGASAVSVAFAVCTLARQIFGSLSDLTVLLIGAGETTALVARHLCTRQVGHLIIANRTRSRAETLARQVGAEIITLAEVDQRLADADIIISSTASPLPIIGKGMVERALKARRNQPILLIDIAVPRDIEPEISRLPNAYLYSVDDLHAIIAHNLAQRQAAAIQAESIVALESMNFMTWLRSQGAVGIIRDYRSRADQICAEMITKAVAAIEHGADAERVIHELAYKLSRRLIHAPTKSLQQAACDGDVARLQLLRDSLGLGDH